MDFWRKKNKSQKLFPPLREHAIVKELAAKQAHPGFRHPGSRAVGTECGGIHARASKLNQMDKDNEIPFAIRPYESSDFEVKKENLGVKSFTAGLQLVGLKVSLIYVWVLSNQCV